MVKQAGKAIKVTRTNWRISLWINKPTIWQQASDEASPLYCTGGVSIGCNELQVWVWADVDQPLLPNIAREEKKRDFER